MEVPACPECGSTLSTSRSTGRFKPGSGAATRRMHWKCRSCETVFGAESGGSPLNPQDGLSMYEHQVAADLQKKLMPAAIPHPPGFEIAALLEPSPEIRGDYFDVFPVEPDRLAFVCADVSGIGIAAVLVMAGVRGYVREEAARDPRPREVAVRLNALLYPETPRGTFVTMLYGVLNMKTNILTCVSLGHDPMIHWSREAKSCRLVNPNGIALGLDRGPVFDRAVREESVQLLPGDRFVMYTDGFVKAMNEREEPYTAERFRNKINELADWDSRAFVFELLRDVQRYLGDAPQQDDMTILTCRTLPPEPKR